LAAKEKGTDPYEAIERIVSWNDFARTVSEAEELAQPKDFDFLGLMSNGFPQMRRYTPLLLEQFDFRAAPAARLLLEVVEILRAMNRDKSRSVPQNAPLEWINQRLRPYVVTDEGIDRRFYELCALTELKNRLRSGDVWVTGSRQFKDFAAYLLEPSRFAELKVKQALSLPVKQDRDAYVAGRIAQLKQALDEVDGLAARGKLPDAAVSERPQNHTAHQLRTRRGERADAPCLRTASSYQDHRPAVGGGPLDGLQPALHSYQDRRTREGSDPAADRHPGRRHQSRHLQDG
jgi:hypothetical protein